MKIRELQEKDAEYMYEWMQDIEVIEFLSANFMNKTIFDCREFIKNSKDNTSQVNLAICDDNDEYMGTVSLKNIDYNNKNAEYAITMRNKAIGHGYSKYATNEILKIAFCQLNLHKVYLCVTPENVRAKKFYEKCNFTYEGTFLEHKMNARTGKLCNLEWYRIVKNEYKKNEI